MSHLGERISDLVDGRLEPEVTELAHAHMVACEPCRQQVEAERLTKSRLAALPVPEPGDALTARLLAVAQVTPVEQPDLTRAGSARPATGHPSAETAPDGVPPGSRRPGGSRRPAGPAVAPARSSGRLARRPARLRLAAAVAGSVSAFSAGLFGLSVISPAANAAVMPGLDMLTARRVITMSGLPILNIAPAWRTAHQGR